MDIQQLPLDKIKPYSRNPRNNSTAIKVVAESIKEYGFQQPIVVDKNYVIIVGHTRYAAAQQLKLDQVPVLIADKLNKEQVQAYRLADNKTNEYAAWDDVLLAEELRELMSELDDNISEVSRQTAFTELEIDRLLNGKNYLEDLAEARHQREGTVNRRIGLLVIKTTYVNRGIATYVNGWLEWGLRNNVQVDVISNAPLEDVSNNQFNRYEGVSNWLAPDHMDTSRPDYLVSLHQPIINLKDSLDLRTSILEALTKYNFDALIINNLDTLYTVVSLGLDQYHPNIYYPTHAVEDVGGGKGTWINDVTHKLLEYSPIKLLCQSEHIKSVAKDFLGTPDERLVVVTPMLGQPELLTIEHTEEPKGILYIGPYEDRKNPEIFISACRQSGKPAILITPSQHSADKFKKRFLQEGIEHEIYVGLSGKNKVTAMQNAALAIIPSREETYCYTAIEAAHVCRTIIPSDYAWTAAHKNWCILTEEKNIVNIVNEHYGRPLLPEHRQALEDNFKLSESQGWLVMAQQPGKETVNNALTKYIDKLGSITLRNFFNSRPKKVFDEMCYAIKITNHEDYEFTQTLTDTVITRVGFTRHFTQDEMSDNLANVFNLGTTDE
jgi:glycosyltransferase involved in cell wall biosynthesis